MNFCSYLKENLLRLAVTENNFSIINQKHAQDIYSLLMQLASLRHSGMS